jgi:hypothetical protein
MDLCRLRGDNFCSRFKYRLIIDSCEVRQAAQWTTYNPINSCILLCAFHYDSMSSFIALRPYVKASACANSIQSIHVRKLLCTLKPLRFHRIEVAWAFSSPIAACAHAVLLGPVLLQCTVDCSASRPRTQLRRQQ